MTPLTYRNDKAMVLNYGEDLYSSTVFEAVFLPLIMSLSTPIRCDGRTIWKYFDFLQWSGVSEG